MRKPIRSRSPLFATNSTISKAKKPICRKTTEHHLMSVCQCQAASGKSRMEIELTIQALLFHLSALSTKPKVAGATSGLDLGWVTPCRTTARLVKQTRKQQTLLYTISCCWEPSSCLWERDLAGLLLCHFRLQTRRCEYASPVRALNTLLAVAALSSALIQKLYRLVCDTLYKCCETHVQRLYGNFPWVLPDRACVPGQHTAKT